MLTSLYGKISIPRQTYYKFEILTERNFFTGKVCPKQKWGFIYDPINYVMMCQEPGENVTEQLKNNKFYPFGVTASFLETLFS